MVYLLDANVLITAHHTYYPTTGVPEYWEWLSFMGSAGKIKIPYEIWEEIKEGPSDTERDLLFAWLKKDTTTKALLLDDEIDPALVQQVTLQGYAHDLTDDEVEKIGRDPFLIAYALAGPDRCVVTAENSSPSKIRQNRKVPDVCDSLDVQWCNPFQLNKLLNFRTRWREDIPALGGMQQGQQSFG